MKRRAWIGIAACVVACGGDARADDAGAVDAGDASADAGDASADAGDASADAGDASADAGAAEVDAGDADAGAAEVDAGASTIATCVEHVPEGASRPSVTEVFPKRGWSGYAAQLQVVITHGKGETVLPEGFRFQASSDAGRGLSKAGFTIPDPTGGVAPTIKTVVQKDGKSQTTLTIPIVPLPDKPGRTLMFLPPLPIAIGRASNEFITICTRAHLITVEDPIGNQIDPKVKPNPPARPQREDWPLARNLAIGIPIGVAIAALAMWLYVMHRRRPRIEPEKPKAPPWITALEELERIRKSKMLVEGRTGEYFDRVSEAVRAYLGGRYGFEETLELGKNGLETTTAEMLDLLKRVRPPVQELPRIKAFLDDCDLVKFARLEPTEALCVEALERGEQIVRRTIPVMKPATPPSPSSKEASS